MLKLNKTERLLQRFAIKLQARILKAEEATKETLPSGLVPMSTILKPGKSGKVRIENYEVSGLNAQLYNLQLALGNTPEMAITPGSYTRLIVDEEVMMSDAPYEARSNVDIIEGARGDVLIAGLGMGMVLIPILLKKSVRSVFVVEKNRDVIKLVWPCIKKWREHQGMVGAKPAPLVLEEGSIFDWTPPMVPLKQKFDVIYFDIWPTISKKNLVDANILKKQFKKYLKPGGWMGVWVEKEIRERKNREAKELARLRAKNDSKRNASGC